MLISLSSCLIFLRKRFDSDRYGQMLDMIANRKHHGTKLISDAKAAWESSEKRDIGEVRSI